jgi:hypothetical protein
MAELTPKQRKFVDNLVITGMSVADSYRSAFGQPEFTPKKAGTLAGRHCHVNTAATQKRTASPFSSRSSHDIPPVHCFSAKLAQCSA